MVNFQHRFADSGHDPPAVPDELRSLEQWLVWKSERKENGDWTKVPYQAKDPGRKARTNDPVTWSSFEEAYLAAAAEQIGFGFVFQPPHAGVDLDGMRDPQSGELDFFGKLIARRLQSYTEASPSGTGAHAIVRSSGVKLPKNVFRFGGKRKVEVYKDGRYFTFTGARLNGHPQVEERTAELQQLVDDLAVLEQAYQNPAFVALFEHGESGGDYSQDDYNLCCRLARLTGGDREATDRLYRESMLENATNGKWDRKQSGTTYGGYTIEKALADPGTLKERSAGVLRLRGVDLSRVKPMRWLWSRRIPVGTISLIIGEEGVGKGLIAAWAAAGATRGELDGDLQSEPVNVLIIGDEDDFEQIWVPRLEAAGADLSRVLTLDDGQYLDDLNEHADALDAAVQEHEIGFVILDQVLDHVNGGENGGGVYNPKNVRQAMLPLRRLAGKRGIAATGLLHPIKGEAHNFRDLVAGSHQFNAVSRSSLLLGVDPDDEGRRVLVRGKGNHSAPPPSFEFRIATTVVSLNGYDLEMPLVIDPHEGKRSIRDLMGKKETGKADWRPTETMREVSDLLVKEGKPMSKNRLRQNIRRRDATVEKAIAALEREGYISVSDSGKAGVAIMVVLKTPFTGQPEPEEEVF